MRLRLAVPADVPALTAVELSAGELFIGTHMAWAIGQSTDPVELLDRIGKAAVWIAEDGRGIGGFLITGTMDGDFYIDELSVATSHQRRGVGRTLIEAVLCEAKRQGFRTATLTTDRDLPWNAPYYARLGFRILTPGETPPELSVRLASQPSPDRRCAMRRTL